MSDPRVLAYMSLDPDVTRRAVLGAGAATLGVAALAACASSSSAAGSGKHSGASSGDVLVSLADVTVGRAVSVTLADGSDGIVSRPTPTTAVCFSAICPHQGCTVKPAPSSLDCPCHGSRFAIDTGTVLNGPATTGLEQIKVTIAAGKVVEG